MCMPQTVSLHITFICRNGVFKTIWFSCFSQKWHSLRDYFSWVFSFPLPLHAAMLWFCCFVSSLLSFLSNKHMILLYKARILSIYWLTSIHMYIRSPPGSVKSTELSKARFKVWTSYLADSCVKSYAARQLPSDHTGACAEQGKLF